MAAQDQDGARRRRHKFRLVCLLSGIFIHSVLSLLSSSEGGLGRQVQTKRLNVNRRHRARRDGRSRGAGRGSSRLSQRSPHVGVRAFTTPSHTTRTDPSAGGGACGAIPSPLHGTARPTCRHTHTHDHTHDLEHNHTGQPNAFYHGDTIGARYLVMSCPARHDAMLAVTCRRHRRKCRRRRPPPSRRCRRQHRHRCRSSAVWRPKTRRRRR